MSATGVAEAGPASTHWDPGLNLVREPVGGPPPARPWLRPHFGSALPGRSGDGGSPAQPGSAALHLPIGDRIRVSADPADGSLTVTRAALRIPGTGLVFAVFEIYRSQSGPGSLGPGWSLTTGTDVGLALDPRDGSATLFGAGPVRGTFRRGPDGHGWAAPSGYRATLRGGEDGNFVLASHTTGELWHFSPFGWLVEHRDRNGRADRFFYHPDGSLASVLDTQRRVTVWSRDAQGRTAAIIDPVGATAAAYSYGDEGRLLSVTSRSGLTTRYSYSGGLLSGLLDAAGMQHEFRYDEDGRVSALTVPGPHGRATVSLAYPDERTAVVTDAAGLATVHGFDADGRLVESTGPGGARTAREWNTDGYLTALTDPLGNVFRHEYDAAGNRTARRLPTGATATVTYDDPARPWLPTALRDAAGHRIVRRHDENGNLAEALSADFDTVLDRRERDPERGSLAAATDALGVTTRYGLCPAGNLNRVEPPAPLGPVRYEYDALSRLSRVIDGAGRSLRYLYDREDRLTGLVDETDGTLLTGLEYSPVGEVVRRWGPDYAVSYSWTRSSVGTLLSAVRRSAQDAETEEVRYEYDEAGRLVELAGPGGAVRYGYDAAGLPVSVEEDGAQTTRLDYDAAGRAVAVRFPGGAAELVERDASGRPVRLTVQDPQGVELLDVHYEYRGAAGEGAPDGGRISSLTRAEVRKDFEYDALGRLVRAGQTAFRYDQANNLLALGDIEVEVNAAGQAVRVGKTRFVYDGAGNFFDETDPTGGFGYSATNQIVEGVFGGEKVVEASYDGIDHTQVRRLRETTPDGHTVTHVFGHTALGLSRVEDDGAPTDYVRAPDGRLIAVRTPDGRRLHPVTDHQGSVIALLDAEGALAAEYDYTDWGAVAATGPDAAANALRYRGAYQLQRSAHLLGLYLYTGFWGRYTQADATGQARNLYAYAENDPVNAADPYRTGFWGTLTLPPEAVADAFLGPVEPEDPAGRHRALLGPDRVGPGVLPARPPRIAADGVEAPLSL